MQSWNDCGTLVATMELKQAETLALELMAQHKISGLGCGWTFGFDNARVRFGCCFYGSRRITLSKVLVSVNDEKEVRDTILHEIAHALAGPEAGHGWKWKTKAAAIGARPTRCYTNTTTTIVTTKWEAVCHHCRKRYITLKVSKPDSKLCSDCWYPAYAANKTENVDDYFISFRKVDTLVIPPRGMANTIKPTKPVLLVATPTTTGAPGPFVEFGEIQSVKFVEPEAAPAAVSRAVANMQWDLPKVIAMYKAGSKIVDIAVAMGYKRGQGQNRVRAALAKAHCLPLK